MKNICETLTAQLLEYLALGIYQADEKLPSVRELSTQYHVNPNTIAKVYTGLEEKGYIYALPAKGYYVSKSTPTLKENVLLEMKPLIHQLYLLTRIGGMKDEDIIKLLKEEENRYDRSQTSIEENRA